MNYDIFISYSRKDIDQVLAIKQQLETAIPGLICWFDIDGIESGEEFEEKIIKAINNSSYFIFALSDNSIHSQWTKDEVMYAKNTGKKIIPLLLPGAQLSDWFLFKFGRIDCIDTTKQLQMEKLISNLARWCGKPMAKGSDDTSEMKSDVEAGGSGHPLAALKAILVKHKWIPLVILSPLLFIGTTPATVYLFFSFLYSFKCMPFRHFIPAAIITIAASILAIGFHEDANSPADENTSATCDSIPPTDTLDTSDCSVPLVCE